MTYRLPPLNALRAFEAAARHLSFKRAAAELHVTPGAVSQQVKALEDQLGTPMFERIHNGLILTAEGQRYVAPLRSAFTTISIATESVAPRREGPELVIGTDPDFAFQWLVPRLDRFSRSGNGLKVKIAEASDPSCVLEGRADIALLNGVSSHPDLHADPFLDEALFPAAAPGVAQSLGDNAFGRALPLLVAGNAPDWDRWFAANGPARLDDHARVDFAARDLAVRAAELGKGIVLASTITDTASFAADRLVPAVDGPRIDGDRWYMLLPSGRLDCPEEAAFTRWLAEEGRPGPF
ncbi:MAG: LysR family transcriptional regulator [Thalassobaculaceae bacterium]|nr:LysR family transcriptional regulator [Thalassobaculaceae bacterium]